MSHRELIEELVEGLEYIRDIADGPLVVEPALPRLAAIASRADTLIKKARVIEDCIPLDDAAEAAASQERWR